MNKLNSIDIVQVAAPAENNWPSLTIHCRLLTHRFLSPTHLVVSFICTTGSLAEPQMKSAHKFDTSPGSPLIHLGNICGKRNNVSISDRRHLVWQRAFIFYFLGCWLSCWVFPEFSLSLVQISHICKFSIRFFILQSTFWQRRALIWIQREQR